MTQTDARKTKQQLIDELSSLRGELREMERVAPEAITGDLQLELDKISSNRKLLDNILYLAADAIISIDENQCITRFNQSAEQIFGYWAQEMMGESLEILLSQQFRRHHKKYVADFGGYQVPAGK